MNEVKMVDKVIGSELFIASSKSFAHWPFALGAMSRVRVDFTELHLS